METTQASEFYSIYLYHKTVELLVIETKVEGVAEDRQEFDKICWESAWYLKVEIYRSLSGILEFASCVHVVKDVPSCPARLFSVETDSSWERNSALLEWVWSFWITYTVLSQIPLKPEYCTGARMSGGKVSGGKKWHAEEFGGGKNQNSLKECVIPQVKK